MQPSLSHVRISDRVIQISDGTGNACTLVTGQKKALLYDTMSGALDLKSYVESLTDLDITVVISHGHFDHVCGAWQFGRAYMSALEEPTYAECRRILPEIETNTKVPLPEKLMKGEFDLQFVDIHEGDLFDLGGLTAEAVLLPGHTPGSMGLLLREERLLLVGDAVSPQMCLFLPESLPLDVYVQTLHKVKKLPVDAVMGSHFMKTFPMKAVDEFEKCSQIVGKVRAIRYSFTPVPEYLGTLWFYNLHEPLTGETMCIITPYREEDYPKKKRFYLLR